MNNKLKNTLTSIGGASASLGISAITVSFSDEIGTLTTKNTAPITTSNGTLSTDNSIKNSTESDVGVFLTTGVSLGMLGASKSLSIETKNDVDYDLIEKRANKIYDKYHRNHIPSSQRGKGIIIADTPETAVICNEMFNNTFVDEYHLVLNIESLLLAVSNILDTKELIPEERKQLEKAKNLLIELKAAYTEKKIITLSTKDNETLLFILNSFKKHQENKKSNAKKLIKEKK
jgi:hypothetical protein